MIEQFTVYYLFEGQLPENGLNEITVTAGSEAEAAELALAMLPDGVTLIPAADAKKIGDDNRAAREKKLKERRDKADADRIATIAQADADYATVLAALTPVIGVDAATLLAGVTRTVSASLIPDDKPGRANKPNGKK